MKIIPGSSDIESNNVNHDIVNEDSWTVWLILVAWSGLILKMAAGQWLLLG